MSGEIKGGGIPAESRDPENAVTKFEIPDLLAGAADKPGEFQARANGICVFGCGIETLAHTDFGKIYAAGLYIDLHLIWPGERDRCVIKADGMISTGFFYQYSSMGFKHPATV